MSDVINAHDLGVAGSYIIEAAMQGDIDKLKAENARLKAALDVVFEDAKEIAAQMCNAMAENAKLREQIDAAHMSRLLTENENESLRELAAKMAEALRVGSEWCDRECIVVFGCDGMDECPIAKELRELGVEVDG